MSVAFLCAAGVALRRQINARWPGRDRHSDGWIGDSAHSTRKSDHNPDWADHLFPGVVRALDIDEDLLGEDFANHEIANGLADELRLCGAIGERRLRYVIFEGRISSAGRGWTWMRYSGPSPHDRHLHISFTRYGDDDGAPFLLPILEERAAAPIIQCGATGELVRVIQSSLTARGFDSGPIDGIFGPRTEAAVFAFQAYAGLTPTGVVDPLTARPLGVSIV